MDLFPFREQVVRERFVRFGYSSNGLNRFGNSCSQAEWSPSKARGIEESRSGLITKLLGFYAGNNRGRPPRGEESASKSYGHFCGTKREFEN